MKCSAIFFKAHLYAQKKRKERIDSPILMVDCKSYVDAHIDSDDNPVIIKCSLEFKTKERRQG